MLAETKVADLGRMTAGPVEIEDVPSGGQLAIATVTLGDRRHRLSWQISQGTLSARSDALVPATLFPAMAARVPLQIAGAISPTLLANVPQIQAIMRVWDRRHRVVTVDAPSVSVPQPAPSGRTACFFSGGVDSFYTLLKHRDEITDLIVLRGFDIPIDDHATWSTVAPVVRQVAQRLGKNLIEVESDVRSFADRYVPWEWYYGPALITVALLLQDNFRQFYLASAHSYAGLFPNGSHPMLDPLWGTEELEIVHDGREVSRVEKVLKIVDEQVAMDALRVCWERSSAFNCGRCEKCRRTMVALRIAGALGRANTFPHSLKLKRIARVPIDNEKCASLWEENLWAAREYDADPRLQRALSRAVKGWRRRRAARRLALRIRRSPRVLRRRMSLVVRILADGRTARLTAQASPDRHV